MLNNLQGKEQDCSLTMSGWKYLPFILSYIGIFLSGLFLVHATELNENNPTNNFTTFKEQEKSSLNTLQVPKKLNMNSSAGTLIF